MKRPTKKINEIRDLFFNSKYAYSQLRLETVWNPANETLLFSVGKFFNNQITGKSGISDLIVKDQDYLSMKQILTT